MHFSNYREAIEKPIHTNTHIYKMMARYYKAYIREVQESQEEETSHVTIYNRVV